MGNEYSDSERDRIVIHDTKLENIEMVILRLEAKVDAWQTNFVSKELLEEKLKFRDKRIEQIEIEKDSQKNRTPHWFSVAISGLALFVTILSLWLRK